MRKIFCRIGSKSSIADKIIKLFPKDYTEMIYIEPFAGGASVFWVKNPSSQEIINDIDKDLINSYKLIKTAKLDDPKKYDNFKSLEAMTAFHQSSGGTAIDKLAKAIIKYCSTFSSVGVGKSYKLIRVSDKLKNLDKYKERVKNVLFMSKDYKTVMKKYDGGNSLFYLDPPYENSKKLYSSGDINMNELATFLKTIKGKFILSINNSANIRLIFKDFRIKTVTVKAISNATIGGDDRKELIIMNY